MASPEPAAQPSLAQESPTPTPAAAPSAAPAAEQEGPPQPQEPVPDAEAENAEGEEEGECGFCLFMKAGGCRDTFVAWEECVEAAQKDGDDMVERCHEATANLKKCMDAHADYYAPVLRAEEAVNERAEAEAAAAAAAADDAAKGKGGEPAIDSENKEEAVPQPAASSPPTAGVGNDAENKEEAVPQPAASSLPAAGEAKKEAAVAEKI
ncbi:unnamed protein product [Miscanthus lutarioriparius]|uniref:GCK domain-containing protein n=1 Tax=Miscanthus lutarioriparius TaxID=422564 RepID=A0A811NF27_9POAL|nr:unnamed protein product [Miscanthus lutarioriparius]